MSEVQVATTFLSWLLLVQKLAKRLVLVPKKLKKKKKNYPTFVATLMVTHYRHTVYEKISAIKFSLIRIYIFLGYHLGR